MRRLQAIILILLCLIFVSASVMAQADCPAIIQTVMANLESLCANAERNEACYGNLALDVVPQEGISDFSFEQVGDIEGVNNIAALRLAPLNTNVEAWGVVLMRLQASLPDALPGQNVTFLLFGDTELINAVPAGSDAAPMSAFYLRTGVGEPACAEAPRDGLMVRTPQGVGEVSFSVNGVDVALGSTTFLAAVPGQEMIISTLEGTASMRTREGQIVPILAGSGAKIPIGLDLLPTGASLPPAPYDPDVWKNFEQVINNHFDDFEVREPLTQEELDLIAALWESGQAPCGAAPFLPDCDDLIFTLGGNECALDESGQDFICEADDSFFWDDDFGGDLPRFLSYSQVSNFFASTWDDDYWDNWGGGTDFNEDGFGINDLELLNPYPFEFAFFDDFDLEDFLAEMEGEFPDDFDFEAFARQFEGEFGDSFEAFLDQYDGELPDDFFDQFSAEFGDDFDTFFDDFEGLPDDLDFGDFGDFGDDFEPSEDLGILPPSSDDEDDEPIERALPSGCTPGICVQDAVVACQCVLCGVACPEGNSGGESSSPADGDFGGDVSDSGGSDDSSGDYGDDDYGDDDYGDSDGDYGDDDGD